MNASEARSSSRAKSGPRPSRLAWMSCTHSSSTHFSLKIFTALIGSPR